MARMVRLTATGPYRIEPQDFPKDKALSICACGLSRRLPYCDGSHKGCRDEIAGSLYVYGEDRTSVIEVLKESSPPAAADTSAAPPPGASVSPPPNIVQ